MPETGRSTLPRLATVVVLCGLAANAALLLLVTADGNVAGYLFGALLLGFALNLGSSTIATWATVGQSPGGPTPVTRVGSRI